MKIGDLVRYKDSEDACTRAWAQEVWPERPRFGIVVAWTRKHQYQVKVLMSNGEAGWEYIKELELISENR